jgi:hypothetical protein
LSLYGAGYTVIARYTVSKICRRLQWIKKILIESSLDRKSSWAIVRDGTVAEFSITNTDEPKQYFDQETNNLTVETQRATLKLNLDERLVTVVAENAHYRCSPWSQSVYLCTPKNDSHMSSNNV